MINLPTGAAQYLVRFSEQQVACSQYTLARLGVDRSHCYIKIDEHVILCAPLQFGFKRSHFLASLSIQELTYFQRYVNGVVGLSLTFALPNRQEPLKLFVRCSLAAVGQMRGRDNVGLIVVDFKTTPDDLVLILGNHLEHQDQLKTLYEDYSRTEIQVGPNTAKLLGYNQYGTITEAAGGGRRIQLYALSSRTVEHLEGSSAPERAPGASVAYQLFFQKYRVSLGGSVESSSRLPTGIVRTRSSLAFSPELVEILDDYWFKRRIGGTMGPGPME